MVETLPNISSSSSTSSPYDDTATAQKASMKRTSNIPYDGGNKTWASYYSNHLSAFKQTPERLNLDGRAFYISVHLKLFDCRLNIGDVVIKADNSRAVFLGVRLAEQEEEDRTLLYFCKLPTNDIDAGEFNYFLLSVK